MNLLHYSLSVLQHQSLLLLHVFVPIQSSFLFLLTPFYTERSGFDDEFRSPHSRYTEVRAEEIAHLERIDILAQGKEVGLSILASQDLREVYSFGHLEYDRDTLAKEYERDCYAGKNPNIPVNYFKDDDPTTRPGLSWNLPAAQFFTNWVNYAVYQETPYDWSTFEQSALSASL